MVVINAININKPNYHLSAELDSLNIQIPRHVTLEIQVLACDMDNNMAGLNLLMRS